MRVLLWSTVLLFGCGMPPFADDEDETVFCDLSASFGLLVFVEVQGLDPLTPDLSETTYKALEVTATDGDYVEKLESYFPPADDATGFKFHGASERPGTYVVEAKLPGYVPVSQTAVVNDGVCHVITVELDAKLLPIEE